MTKHTLIHFDAETHVFHLSNDKISYLFSIEAGGLLSHLYFGKKVNHYHDIKKYPLEDRGFSGNLPEVTDRRYSPDTLLQEFSSYGSADFRVPAAIVKQANGSTAATFTYVKHEIIAGKPGLDGLPASYVLDETEAETLIVTLQDQICRTEIELLYTIYRDRAVIARSTRIRNLGHHNIYLEKIASMQIDFPQQKFEVISLPGAHVRERDLQRETLGFGIKTFASRRGASSHQMNSFIALVDEKTNEFSGEAIGFNFIYSGNHAFQLEQDQLKQTRLVIGINEEAFSWELQPDAEFQTPEVLIVYSESGLNEMSNTFHHILRERVARGKFQYQERPILVNNWEATYFDFDEEKLKPIVDEAAELGIEMFVLDDGWFGQRDDDNSSLGDWFVYAKKFPQGLNSFAEYVHHKNLKFGLWLEPEMISFASELYRQHPDYLLQVPQRAPHPSRNQYVLDLGREEVCAEVKKQIKSILDSTEIDYIKWDMNRHISDVYSTVLSAERQGEVLHRYMLGLYELLEDLTTNYPDILWEGCSGGGGRFDAGFMYYMPQSWTSDNTDAIARLRIQYGTSLAYPISNMTAHVSAVPNHQTGRTTSLAMRGAVAMSGVFGYELDLTSLTAAEKKEVKEQVVFYQMIRSLVQYGDFKRLCSPFEGNKTAWQFISPDQKEVLFFVFQVLAEAQPAFTTTRLVDLLANKDYQNLITGEIFGGDELMQIGFYDPIVRQDFAYQIYQFRLVD
ncbi:MAG: alpha-galactosidase [Enterococcus gilvus]